MIDNNTPDAAPHYCKEKVLDRIEVAATGAVSVATTYGRIRQANWFVLPWHDFSVSSGVVSRCVAPCRAVSRRVACVAKPNE